QPALGGWARRSRPLPSLRRGDEAGPCRGEKQLAQVASEPDLGAGLARPEVEWSVRSTVSRDGGVHIVPIVTTGVARREILGLLRIPRVSREVAVEQARCHALAYDGECRAPADPDLPARAKRGPHRDLGDQLRLVDRRDGLRMTRQAVSYHLELGRVDGGELEHRDADAAAPVETLAAPGVGGRADRRRRRPIGRLEGNRTGGGRRPRPQDG